MPSRAETGMRRVTERLALTYALSIVSAIALFAVFDDGLFFHSDARSATVVIGAAGLCLAALVTLVDIVLICLGRPRGIGSLAVLGIPTVVVSTLALLLLDFFQRESRIIGFLNDGHAGLLFVFVCAACAVWLAFRLLRHPDREGISRRVTRLSLVLAPAWLVVAAFFVVQGRLARNTGMAPRHVVLVVLDAWPASSLLHTYNTAMPARPVDQLFADALVFGSMHTNTVWTHGFFDVLYRGTAQFVSAKPPKFRQRFVKDEQGQSSRWNLLSALQDLGVKTRWIAYHRIGFPESHSASDYAGLRSTSLTRRYAGLARALGLDYNLVMVNPTSRSLASPRRRAMMSLLNREKRFDDELHEVLLPEIRALHGESNRSFLMYHGRWPAGPFTPPPAWAESAPNNEQERRAAAIRARDNRYEPGDEQFVDEWRAKTNYHMDLVAGRIEQLLANLAAENLLDNTLLILTADHGSMLDRGRIWYGYHPDEEVTRVPLILFNAGRRGFENVKRESIDLPQTLVDYFGGTERVHPRAVSLLDSSDKEFTATVTLRSKIHHEWFVVLYTTGRKYVFNVEPGSAGESVEMTTDGVASTVTASGPEIVAKVRPLLKQAILELGLPVGELHPRYQEVALARSATAGARRP